MFWCTNLQRLEQNVRYRFLSLFVHLIVVRQGLSLNHKPAILTRLPGQQDLGIHLSLTSGARVTGVCHYAWLFMWVLRNSGPHACRANVFIH